MNERELLERAARAAGIEGAWVEERRPEEGFERVGLRMPERGSWGAWNPLRNSADAFELAVALRMDVMVQDSDARTAVALLTPFTDGLIEHEEPHGSDASAATRRAITTAAAMSATYEEDLT